MDNMLNPSHGDFRNQALQSLELRPRLFDLAGKRAIDDQGSVSGHQIWTFNDRLASEAYTVAVSTLDEAGYGTDVVDYAGIATCHEVTWAESFGAVTMHQCVLAAAQVA